MAEMFVLAPLLATCPKPRLHYIVVLGGAHQAGPAGPLPQAPEDDAAADSGVDSGASVDGGPGDASPKFLVFAHHKSVMNRLAAALEGATGYMPVCYVRIDGATDSEDR